MFPTYRRTVGGRYHTVRSSRFHEVLRNTFHYQIGLKNSVVHGNTIHSPLIELPVQPNHSIHGGHGIYLYGCEQLAVSGNMVTRHVNGIILERCLGIGVTANTISRCKRSGIMAYAGGYNAITGNVLHANATILPGTGYFDSNDGSEIALSAVDGVAEHHDLVTGNVIFNPNAVSGSGVPAAIVEARFSGSTSPYGNFVTGNNFYLQNRPTPGYRVQLLSSSSLGDDNHGNT